MKANIFLFESIRLIQLIVVPLLAFTTLIGIFLFLMSFKNPHRKRKAYLLSTISPIGMFFFLYGPVVLAYYLFKEPSTPSKQENLRTVVDQVQPWGSLIYSIFKVFAEPVIVLLFYIGIGILLLAAKNPARKRIGTGLVIGSPLMWILVQYAPNIYRFFV